MTSNGSTDKYITRQGKVRWRARWDLPAEPDGGRQRRTKGGFTTKTEADRFLRETLIAQDQGNYPTTTTSWTLGDYLDRWLDGKRIRPTTRDNYLTCIQIHTKPRIGHVPISDVSHHTLNALYRELETHGKAARPNPKNGIQQTCRTANVTCQPLGCEPDRHEGLSVKSVQHVHGTLRGALQDAVRDGLILRNPADLATPPRRSAGQRRVTGQHVWSADQARRFLAHVKDDPLEPIWTLALATGMRRGELVGLRWSALDLNARVLEIRTTTTTVRGKDVASTGKTDAARRRISLDEHVTDRLAAHKTRTRPTHQDGDGPVFIDADGVAIRPQRLTNALQRLTTQAGLPNIGVHGLRHTAATLMLNNGVPVHVVASRLGHADASTTLSIYAHVMPSDDRNAAQAIASVLFGTNAASSVSPDRVPAPRPGQTRPSHNQLPPAYPPASRDRSRGIGF